MYFKTSEVVDCLCEEQTEIEVIILLKIFPFAVLFFNYGMMLFFFAWDQAQCI